jgi:uncharacterized membrane protein
VRSGYLDALRGLAVVWMIIFHFAYDLKMFNYVGWDFTQGFWYGFPRVIAFTFLFCVGVSITLAHHDRIHWDSLRKRCLKIGTGAALISLGTWLVFPDQWVFFGTLHCILVGSILGTLIVHQRPLIYGLLIGILIAQYALGYDIQWVSSIVRRPSVDFIPIYPWFWAILLGMGLAPHLEKLSLLQAIRPPRWLDFASKHSFEIYLIHQPLFFGLLWLVSVVL